VQTAIAQFSSLALEHFDLDGPALVRLVLLVQAVALPGALAIGWLSAWWGRRSAAAVCLGGWAAVLRFPNMEAAKAWYDSPEYRPLRQLRIDELTEPGGRLMLVGAFDPSGQGA
jgi:hypothetical protein